MKKIITLSFLFITIFALAQVPQGISYQAIALNTAGAPVVSANVGLRLSILNTSATGASVYTETHTKTTNPQGLFNLVIGQGTVVSGTFNTINWGTNLKFLKVEMDVAGGSNYILVGTTQLLSTPYALAADSLVTSPGEGITLVSPNGTPYLVTVNDAGQLSLPTSGIASTVPNSLYMYGSFNSFNPATSLLMSVSGIPAFYGYKYLTSGTQLKFLSEQNINSPIYGVNASLQLTNNGASYSVISNGFYFINLYGYNNSPTVLLSDYDLSCSSFSPTLYRNQISTSVNPTFNIANNTFSFIVNSVTNANNTFGFSIPETNFFTGNPYNFGDNLSDGSIDGGGTIISFPNTNATPKNFRVDLIINFNGSGTYTITQI